MQVFPRVDPAPQAAPQQAVKDGAALAGPHIADEQVVLFPKGARTYGVLDSVVVDGDFAVLQFIMAGWVPMNEICERAGLSERAIYDRSKAIMHYYNLPYDVPPPP